METTIDSRTRLQLVEKFGFNKPVQYDNIMKSPPMKIAMLVAPEKAHKPGYSYYVHEEKANLNIYLKDDCKGDLHINIVALAAAKLSEQRGIFEARTQYGNETETNWCRTFDNATGPLESLFLLKEIARHIPPYFEQLASTWEDRVMSPQFMAREKLNDVLDEQHDNREDMILPTYILRRLGIHADLNIASLLKDPASLGRWERYMDALLKAAEKEPTLRTYNSLLKEIEATFRIAKEYAPWKKWGFHPCSLVPARN
jgi:hypothetical protein